MKTDMDNKSKLRFGPFPVQDLRTASNPGLMQQPRLLSEKTLDLDTYTGKLCE